MIKYNKENTNKLAEMLLTPPTSKITTLGNLMHMEFSTQNAYIATYIEDAVSKGVFKTIA